MPEFGPFVRYSDPRIYGLIEGFPWGPFQRSLLLGERSWSPAGMSRDRARACAVVEGYLGEWGIKVTRDPAYTRDVVTVAADLPPDDPLLPVMLAQWDLTFDHHKILSVEGPVEQVGRVPIFRGTVFGNIEAMGGTRAIGLRREAYIVGCQGVCAVVRSPTDGSIRPDFQCPMRTARSRFRTTLRRARNTAARVDGMMADWDDYLAATERREAEAAEAARRAAESLEPIDEGLLAF